MSKDKFCMDFGNLLFKARKEAGITQAQLAEMAGIDFRDISRYENGKVEPTASTVFSIAKALNISVDELVPIDMKSQKQIAEKQLIIETLTELDNAIHKIVVKAMNTK